MFSLFKHRESSETQPIADAIAALSAAPSECNRQALYRVLLRGKLFLATGGLPSEWAESDSITLDRATDIPTLTSSAPDGTKALLAFTDREQVRRRNADASSFAMESRAVLELVVSGAFGALIVNPNGPWAAIPRADIERLLEAP